MSEDLWKDFDVFAETRNRLNPVNIGMLRRWVELRNFFKTPFNNK